MNRFTKTLLVITFLSVVNIAFADRGVGKKSKNKTTLNISTPTTLRNSISLNLKLKSGLSYKGSLLTSTQQVGNSIMNTSIVTYQKGNSIYIIPYKHKIAMPEMRQGYTGVKVIIKAH